MDRSDGGDSDHKDALSDAEKARKVCYDELNTRKGNGLDVARARPDQRISVEDCAERWRARVARSVAVDPNARLSLDGDVEQRTYAFTCGDEAIDIGVRQLNLRAQYILGPHFHPSILETRSEIA